MSFLPVFAFFVCLALVLAHPLDLGSSWKAIKSPQSMRCMCNAVTLGNQVFVIGTANWGENLPVTVYNPSSRVWATTQLPFNGSVSSVAAVDTLLYFYPSWRTLGALDTRRGVYIHFPPSPVNNIQDVVVTSNSDGSIIYAIGGYTVFPASSSLPYVQAYDTVRNTWTYTNMSEGRTWPGAAVVGSRLYVFGGSDLSSASLTLSSAEVYDTRTRQWRSLPHMSSGTSSPSVVTIGTSIYVLGGGGCETCARLFDTHTETWTDLPSLPFPMYQTGQGAAQVNGVFYFPGLPDSNTGMTELLAWAPSQAPATITES